MATMESLEACQRVASSIGVSETMWRQGGRWVKIKRQCSKSQRLSEKSGTDESFYLGTSDGSAGMLDGTTMSRKSGLDDHESTDSDCCYLEEDFSDNEEPESIHDLMECISIRSRSFHLETVSLRYNLLRDEHVKTLCVTLMYNKSVKQLDLRCCQLSSQSCQYVCEMLSHNHVITNLDLSENSLRTTGLIMLRDCLLLNMAISKLYLDFNDFTDSDAIHLYAILKTSNTLRELSIQGNQMCTIAGEVFHKVLKEDFSLSSLNISWNHLRMDAAIALVQGLGMNSKLVELDLSWNGLGLPGSKAMAICLQLNSTLRFLDLSSNRISREAFTCLLEGLLANKALQILKIGDNPITTDGVMDFMNMLAKAKSGEMMRACREVDFADICVGKEFDALYTEIRRLRDITIKHGSTLRQADMMQIDLATVVHSEQPIFVLFDCMRKSNLRIVDLFHAFDKDKNGSLTRQELKEGLLSMSIPLSSRALDLLIKKTDTDNDGEIVLTDLMAVQKDYQKHLAKKRTQEQREKSASTERRGKALVGFKL